ncbi:MAG: ABC transporter permease, partial [Dehalococcoidia bacterium]
MLTMLGIIIGVGAVITMVALGTGAQKAVQQRIQALGPDLLSLY